VVHVAVASLHHRGAVQIEFLDNLVLGGGGEGKL
jgi:hypothetical protein